MDLRGIHSLAEDNYNKLIISLSPLYNQTEVRKIKGNFTKLKAICSTEHRAMVPYACSPFH
jgi:hypothetical protein